MNLFVVTTNYIKWYWCNLNNYGKTLLMFSQLDVSGAEKE
jgi:hypothetical protein